MFGFTSLEAMSQNCPVLISNFSLTTKWKDYPQEIKDIILRGSNEKIDFSQPI